MPCSTAYRPVNSLLGIQVDFIRAMALFSRIFGYLDMPAEISNKAGALAPKAIRGHLAFQDVSFHYTAGKPVLEDISFEVETGKTVAIVGPSGAGKSTIINLIPRLYDVTGGRVLLDGIDIRQLDLTALRRNVGIVTQESYSFNELSGTISFMPRQTPPIRNRQGLPGRQYRGIYQLLASGLRYPGGEPGVKLGGEKQRLAIARVILKDPRLLILDEATSSLDSISESLIQQALSRC